jgi:hypothetical protein
VRPVNMRLSRGFSNSATVAIRDFARRLASGQRGMALPSVLIVMAIGSLLLVPCLNYVSDNVRIAKAFENRTMALYAAEAGVEDAFWKLKFDEPSSFPCSYDIEGINGMSVDVLIEEVTTIAGLEIGATNIHEGWLKITKSQEYIEGEYTYTLTIENGGLGNMKIEQVLVDLEPDLEYVPGSTESNISTSDPLVIGEPESGITLFWQIPSPFFVIGPHVTETFSFGLSGPEMPEIDSHAMLKASREDIGVVWDSESRPFSVTATARNSSGQVVSTLVVGVWKSPTSFDISCWLLNP